jgi:hypothetical protein
MSGEFDFFFFLSFFAMVSSIYASQRTLTRLHRFWITQSPEPWLQWPAWTTPLHRVQVSFFYKVHQYILSTVHWFHNWEAWHCDMHRLKDDELAELLIRSGANLNSTDFYGHTPLWYIYIRHWWHCPNYQLACCVPDDLRHFMLYVGWPQKDKGPCSSQSY